MSKIDSIIDFSIILNRGYGSSSDCDHFATLNHPQLITLLIEYINLNKDYIGLTRIEPRQSIADSGCDVFVELRGKVKIGIQIKSKGDVEADDFTGKVKAQYAESSALGLDKYYVLICSPITTSSERKINYIVSHMATYKTNYHAILNPNNCVGIFKSASKLPENEFVALKQLYSKEESKDNLELMLTKIKESLSREAPIRDEFSVDLENAINRKPFERITSATRFIEFLQLDKTVKQSEVLVEINSIIGRIGKLSIELRRLFYLVILESTDASNFSDSLETNLHELQSLLPNKTAELRAKLSILANAKYKLIRLDEDEPHVARIFVWLPGDYNFVKELRSFCENNTIELERILVDGDFSLLGY